MTTAANSFVCVSAVRSGGRRTPDLAVQEDLPRVGRDPEKPEEGGASPSDHREVRHRAGHVISRKPTSQHFVHFIFKKWMLRRLRLLAKLRLTE